MRARSHSSLIPFADRKRINALHISLLALILLAAQVLGWAEVAGLRNPRVSYCGFLVAMMIAIVGGYTPFVFHSLEVRSTIANMAVRARCSAATQPTDPSADSRAAPNRSVNASGPRGAAARATPSRDALTPHSTPCSSGVSFCCPTCSSFWSCPRPSTRLSSPVRQRVPAVLPAALPAADTRLRTRVRRVAQGTKHGRSTPMTHPMTRWVPTVSSRRRCCSGTAIGAPTRSGRPFR